MKIHQLWFFLQLLQRSAATTWQKLWEIDSNRSSHSWGTMAKSRRRVIESSERKGYRGSVLGTSFTELALVLPYSCYTQLRSFILNLPIDEEFLNIEDYPKLWSRGLQDCRWSDWFIQQQKEEIGEEFRIDEPVVSNVRAFVRNYKNSEVTVNSICARIREDQPKRLRQINRWRSEWSDRGWFDIPCGFCHKQTWIGVTQLNFDSTGHFGVWLPIRTSFLKG